MTPVLSSDFVAAALGLSKPPSLQFQSVTTDSRKVGQGSLFVAIPGEQFDGHQFIEAAVKAGATGIVGEKSKLPASLPKHIAVFAVSDTTEAYRRLGGAWRRLFNIPVVVVAGSVGKTTTKELLSAILRGKFSNVVSTRGSQNGYLGIPMTLLDIQASTEIAVIEVGIDEIGAMKKHIELVLPTASLLTAIGPEHLEKLIDVPTVAKEEALALTLTAKSGGVTVVNMDDPWIRKIHPQLVFSQQVWRCGMLPIASADEAADSKITQGDWIESTTAGQLDTLKITRENGSQFELSLPLPGRHNASNLLLAVAMALALELSPIEIQRGLAQFQGAYGRSELRVLPQNTPVVCDYYNANPSSVEAGLDVLSQVARAQGARAKHAVLGDMLELGALEEQMHRDLSKSIASHAIERVFLFGPRMKWLEDELKKSGFHGEVLHFADHQTLANRLISVFRLGDALLIKGSRGMKMEEVWKIVEPKLLEMSTA